MPTRPRGLGVREGGLLLVACLAAVAGGARAAPGLTGQAEQGRLLFGGQRPFQNGGPACAICHDIAGMRFPAGGTLGPDLTGEYSKLGPDGTAVALQTLFFPTMAPIFAGRLATPEEQADLTAFLQAAGSLPRHWHITGWIVLIALAGFGVLLAATALAGRRRLGRTRSVRARLVEQARAERSEALSEQVAPPDASPQRAGRGEALP